MWENSEFKVEFSKCDMKEFERVMLSSGQCSFFMPMGFMGSENGEAICYDCSGFSPLSMYRIERTEDALYLLEQVLLILGKAVAEKRRIPAAIYGAGLVLIPVLYLALFLFLPSGMRLSGLLERYAGSLMAIWICLAAANLFERIPLAAPGKVCAFLGRRSLECYLVHVMVLHLMNDVSRDRSRYLGLGKSAAAYLVLMALCVLLANLIYRLARFITKKAGKLAQ